ncbi:hypothetical protein B0H17DRAFT_1146365 [Mycena rosella]|uniref:Uncharacterized protein n=1 Tax=Mycena rosella TaxID=1033263 RepID=A0AAD7G1G3_MYCRO|nr:hypothetical protein B0H17DRAFT_1146365 [Mycena rosella]
MSAERRSVAGGTSLCRRQKTSKTEPNPIQTQTQTQIGTSPATSRESCGATRDAKCAPVQRVAGCNPLQSPERRIQNADCRLRIQIADCRFQIADGRAQIAAGRGIDILRWPSSARDIEAGGDGTHSTRVTAGGRSRLSNLNGGGGGEDGYRIQERKQKFILTRLTRSLSLAADGVSTQAPSDGSGHAPTRSVEIQIHDWGTEHVADEREGLRAHVGRRPDPGADSGAGKGEHMSEDEGAHDEGPRRSTRRLASQVLHGAGAANLPTMRDGAGVLQLQLRGADVYCRGEKEGICPCRARAQVRRDCANWRSCSMPHSITPPYRAGATVAPNEEGWRRRRKERQKDGTKYLRQPHGYDVAAHRLERAIAGSGAAPGWGIGACRAKHFAAMAATDITPESIGAVTQA